MKRFFKHSICLLLALFLVVACSKDQEPTENLGTEENETAIPLEEGGEITFMIPDWGAPTEEMIQEFKEETGITVHVQPTSWDDIRDKIATATAGGTVAADVFEVDWAWAGEFVSADWLLPIEMDQKDIDDMPSIQSFMVEDTVYAVPYANDFRIAYSNEKYFKEAGIEELPHTWDQLIEDARKMKEEGVLEYPISIPMGAEEGATTSLFWFAYSRNGIVFNDDNTLNEESIKDVLELYEIMNKEGLINPANATTSGQEAYRQILTGDTAFMVGPSSYVSRVNDEEASEVVGEIVPSKLLGKEDYSKATVPFAEAIGISKNTENPEAAKKFVEWYTSPETQVRLNEELSVIPTRNTVLKDLIDQGIIEDNGAMVELSEMIESPFPNGVPDYYTEMSTTIFNIVNQVATGQLTAEVAAEIITEQVNQLAE